MTKVFYLLALTLMISNIAHAATNGCANAPKPVSACRSIHGRLTTYNGRWSAIIWVVGTKHRIGILNDKEDKDMLLPDNVIYGPYDEVYGDFTVCPLVSPHKGQVEEVCVQSAKHLFIQRHG